MDNEGSKLRVIQVVNVRWLNATAWYGLYLSRLLKQAGHEVKVLGLGGTDSFARAREWGLEPVALPLNTGNPLKAAALYADLRSLVRAFRPQIVNCHRGESFLLWGFLKNNLSGAPFALVRTRGDQRPIRNNPFNRRLYARTADALIATNSGIASSMTELGAPPDKVSTILGGVDEKAFYPDRAAGREVREALGLAADDFVVGLLGRLDPVKGHAVLIRALGRLREKYGPGCRLRLLCVGAQSGISYSELDGWLRAAGLDGQSRVTGRVENVRAYINAMDLGVLASVSSEAIARAALEIMACAVPLLSSDVGVMPDILPAETLLPAGDASALAESLEKYWQNPQKLARLTQIARLAVDNLKSGDFLEKTLKVYFDCLRRMP